MAIFHLRVRTASRSSGASAAASAGYILRLGKYSKAGLDPCVYSHAGNMPVWASGSRQKLEYWRSADQYERVNGRLFKSLEFALPRELAHVQRVALARDFCTAVARTDCGQHLPFLLAVHAGGEMMNSHCHVQISERVADGYDRTPELWFSRAAPKGKKPESGGSRKTSDLKPREWLLKARELLACLTNEALAAAGLTARVDHRSLAAQGINRIPGVHLGPADAARLRRGLNSRRADDLARHQADEQHAQQLIAELGREASQVAGELAEAQAGAALLRGTAELLARAQRDASHEKNNSKTRGNDYESPSIR